MTLYDKVFDHLLVKMDAEKAHHLTYDALRAGGPVLSRAPIPAARPSGRWG